MADIIREPQQQRSIDKKNRIIEAGYKLFAEKGYFNTNTAEIAKRAGVSTGIVYGYFRDKRDILIEVLEIYIDNIFAPVLSRIDAITPPLDFSDLLPEIMDITIDLHKRNAAIHEALHSLSSTDKLVNDKFIALENTMTEVIASRLSALGYNKPHVTERVHVALGIVQSYAHECVYDQHPYIDYVEMRKIVEDMLRVIFEKD